MHLYILYLLFVITIFGCIVTKNFFSILIYLGSAITIFIGFLALLSVEKNTFLIFDSIIIYSIVGLLSTLTLTKYFYALKK